MYGIDVSSCDVSKWFMNHLYLPLRFHRCDLIRSISHFVHLHLLWPVLPFSDLLSILFCSAMHPFILFTIDFSPSSFICKALPTDDTVVELISLKIVSSFINIRVFAITRTLLHCVSPYFKSLSMETAHKSTITLVSALLHTISLEYQRLRRFYVGPPLHFFPSPPISIIIYHICTFYMGDAISSPCFHSSS